MTVNYAFNNATDSQKTQMKKNYRQLKDQETISVGDLLDTDIPPQEWIIEGLVDDEGMDIIAGRPKDFKSGFILSACIHIAIGRPFMGLKVKKLRTLIVDEENGIRRTDRRLEKLILAMKLTPEEITDLRKNLGFSIWKGIQVTSPEGIQKLEALIVKHKPKFIVVDSLVRVMTGKENDVGDARKVFHNIKPLFTQYGVKFQFVHHTRKNGYARVTVEDVRGSGDFIGQVNQLLVMNRDGKTENGVQFFNIFSGVDRDFYVNRAYGIKFKIYDKLFEDKTGLVVERIGEMQEGEVPNKADKVPDLCEKDVLKWAEEEERAVLTSEFVDKFKEKYAQTSVEKALSVLTKEGKLIRPRQGRYIAVRD
ncbi:MAG: AAA family ATPase [Candidatus Diapherotrites archaeon]